MVKHWKNGGWGVLVNRVNRISSYQATSSVTPGFNYPTNSQNMIAQLIPMNSELSDYLHGIIDYLKVLKESGLNKLSQDTVSLIKHSLELGGWFSKAVGVGNDEAMRNIETDVEKFKTSASVMLNALIQIAEDGLKFIQGQKPLPPVMVDILNTALTHLNNMPNSNQNPSTLYMNPAPQIISNQTVVGPSGFTDPLPTYNPTHTTETVYTTVSNNINPINTALQQIQDTKIQQNQNMAPVPTPVPAVQRQEAVAPSPTNIATGQPETKSRNAPEKLKEAAKKTVETVKTTKANATDKGETPQQQQQPQQSQLLQQKQQKATASQQANPPQAPTPTPSAQPQSRSLSADSEKLQEQPQ
jgi:hypothetical protein